MPHHTTPSRLEPHRDTLRSLRPFHPTKHLRRYHVRHTLTGLSNARAMDRWERRKGWKLGAKGQDTQKGRTHNSARQVQQLALGIQDQAAGKRSQHNLMSKTLTCGRGALGERSGSCVRTGSEEPEEAGHQNMATEREGGRHQKEQTNTSNGSAHQGTCCSSRLAVF